MRTIRIIERAERWPFQRHAPAGDGIWNDTQFYVGRGLRRTDWLVVISWFHRTLRFPRNRTILLASEPAPLHRFSDQYQQQFGTVVTSDAAVNHPDVRLTHPALPWHVGVDRSGRHAVTRLSYADLAKAPQKTKLCACICSSQSFTQGHRDRLAFVDRLREALGDRIDFYGRGFRTMVDKAEALDSYRYHIVLENCVEPHYWTEKLADAFLRNCYPIYSGAPNVGDYFAADALTAIDIRRPDEAIATIARVLDSDLDRRAASAIATAKQLVLTRYNILSEIAALAEELERKHPIPDPPTILRSETGLRRYERRRKGPFGFLYQS